MKKDIYQDDFPNYYEELEEEEGLFEHLTRKNAPRRAQRKKRGNGAAKVVVGAMFGILLGLGIGATSRLYLFTAGSGGLIPDSFWSGVFGQGDGEYKYDEGFDFDHSGNVESNAESSKEYSLPRYEGDSSGLTIELQSAAAEEELSRVELYEADLPTTVSITVYAGNSAAYGSGMILTEDGYILTCAHVVENTASAVVTTSDGKQYEAEMVGSDPQTDLAVLKIKAKGLTPVVFANSDELVIGEEVCAIGDPLGPKFRGSLTNGIISGLNRQISSNGYAMTLIQTTAAVNSGNSGGPLFNSRGQVVGVVNMKMSATSAAASIDNMGLAVPSVIVKEIVETLATEGSVSRTVLGISCYDIDETTARVYAIPQGLWITNIDQNSDCAKKGILLNDIITQVDGKAVRSVSQFKEMIADRDVGDTVTLTIWREPKAEEAEGDASASGAFGEPEGYHYEYYGDITVALMNSTDLVG